MKMATLGPLESAAEQSRDWQQDKASIIAFLKSGRPVTAARTRTRDQLDPQRRRRVPVIYYTDGEWLWSAAIAYYAEHHDIPVAPELLDHARARGFTAGAVPDSAIAEAKALLRDRSEERHREP